MKNWLLPFIVAFVAATTGNHLLDRFPITGLILLFGGVIAMTIFAYLGDKSRNNKEN